MKVLQNIILICVSLSFLNGCKPKMATEIVDVNALPASAIFNDDSDYVFMQMYGNKNKEIALNYLQQIKKYESSNTNKAIYCAKRAITLMPCLESYKALAQLFENSKQYNEQYAVFSFLCRRAYLKTNAGNTNEYIFGKPTEDLFYEFIISQIQSNMNMFDMSYELDNLGYDDKKSIRFQNILLQFLPFEELKNYSMKPENFKLFFKSIADTNSCFSITENSIKKFNYRYSDAENFPMDGNSVSASAIYYTYEKDIDSLFYLNYNFNRAYLLNENIYVLEYAVDSSELGCDADMRHIYHRIITYDSNAKIIDSKVIAYQSGEEMALATVICNRIVMDFYKRDFKHAYIKKEMDNELVSIKKTQTKSFFIDENGYFKEMLTN
jgi:hypothetical protein